MLARAIGIALGGLPGIETPKRARGSAKVHSGESQAAEMEEARNVV